MWTYSVLNLVATKGFSLSSQTQRCVQNPLGIRNYVVNHVCNNSPLRSLKQCTDSQFHFVLKKINFPVAQPICISSTTISHDFRRNHFAQCSIHRDQSGEDSLSQDSTSSVPSSAPINVEQEAGEAYGSSLDDDNHVWDHVGPAIMPTFNYAAYANDSVNIQKLVQLGVNLSKVEKKYGPLMHLVRLDFDKQIAPVIKYVYELIIY